MPRVRLIALDLDGTLLEWDKTVLPEVKEALSELAESGVFIATSSGRPYEYQVRVLSENGLGAEAGFPHALIANEQEIYVLKGGRYEPARERNDELERRWGELLPVAMDVVEREAWRLSSLGVEVRVWPGSRSEARARKLCGLLFERGEEARAEERLLRMTLRSSLRCNRHFNLVQVMLREAGKGNSVLFLAGMLGIEPSEVLCVGDASNDVCMLDGSLGFLSATFVTAEREVKEAVRAAGGYVASQPCGRGLLEVLRELSLI